MKELKHPEFSRYIRKYQQEQITMPLQNTTASFHYNLIETNLEYFINIAMKQSVVCLNDQVIYILTIKDHHEYQSLVFYTNGHIVKSPETTSKIMLRYFRQKNSPYSAATELGKLLDIHQKCPYIIEGICFAPDGGFTKNNVNWIGLHHIQYFEGDNDMSVLKIQPYSELILPLNINRLHKMVHNSSLMAIMHQAISQFVMNQFSFLNEHSQTSNVITQYIHKMSHQTSIPNPYEVYHYLEQQKVVNLMKNIMGIDFPTEEELDMLIPSLKSFKDNLSAPLYD